MVGGDTPLSAVPLMALDVETTGLDPVKDGIVSIGLVPMSLERIRASASRHWILKPRVPLGAESVTIHGITDSQVMAAPDLDQVLGEVLQAMAGHVLVVHCRDIERQFLNGALRPRIGEGIAFPVIDTMELEARLHRNQPRGWLNWALGRHPPQASIRLADSRAPLQPAALPAAPRAHRCAGLGRVAAGAGGAPLFARDAGARTLEIAASAFAATPTEPEATGRVGVRASQSQVNTAVEPHSSGAEPRANLAQNHESF